MEDSGAFRVAAAPAAPATTASASSKSGNQTIQPDPINVEPALSIYEEVNGKPLTADFFELGLFMEGDGFDNTKADIRAFEQFVRQEIRDRGLTDSKASYEEIVKQLESEIGGYENEEKLERFRRLSSAANAMSRLRNLSKQPILNGANLTPKEYDMIYAGRHRG